MVDTKKDLDKTYGQIMLQCVKEAFESIEEGLELTLNLFPETTPIRLDPEFDLLLLEDTTPTESDSDFDSDSEVKSDSDLDFDSDFDSVHKPSSVPELNADAKNRIEFYIKTILTELCLRHYPQVFDCCNALIAELTTSEIKTLPLIAQEEAQKSRILLRFILPVLDFLGNYHADNHPKYSGNLAEIKKQIQSLQAQKKWLPKQLDTGYETHLLKLGNTITYIADILSSKAVNYYSIPTLPTSFWQEHHKNNSQLNIHTSPGSLALQSACSVDTLIAELEENPGPNGEVLNKSRGLSQ